MRKAFLQRSEKKIEVIRSILGSVKGLKGTVVNKTCHSSNKGSRGNFVNDPFINCFLFAGHISLSNLKETIQILDKICQLLFKLIEMNSEFNKIR